MTPYMLFFSSVLIKVTLRTVELTHAHLFHVFSLIRNMILRNMTLRLPKFLTTLSGGVKQKEVVLKSNVFQH